MRLEPSEDNHASGAALLVYIDERAVLARAGETLLEVAERNGGLIDSQCLAGACGTCMVRVVEGAELLEPPDGAESILLSSEELVENKRLACQARLRGSVRVVSAGRG